VANILLARGATRQKEIAFRGALGAGHARLVRQFLTESLTLGAAGGALGIWIAHFGLTPLRALLPANGIGGLALQLDPIGQFVSGACGKENEWCQVVGVVVDVHQHVLDQAARPAVYVPYNRDPWLFRAFVVRTGRSRKTWRLQ
jgi:hypothetical protein